MSADAYPPARMSRASSVRDAILRFPVVGLVYLLVVTYCAAWGVSRGWGELALASVLAICVPYLNATVLRQVWPFVALAGLYGLYALVSPLGLLQLGWTRLFDTGAIPQQLVSYPAFLLLVCLFQRVSFATGLMSGDAPLVTAVLLKVILILSRLWAGDVDIVAVIFGVENLTNQHCIPMLLFFCWSMVTRPSQRWTFVGALYVLICAGTTSAAFFGAFAMLFGVFGARMRSAVLVALCLACFSILAPLLPLQLLAIDPNSGVRAFFWQDAWALAVQSHFLGIGLGTELVQNYYPLISFDWRLIEEGNRQLIFVGVHSSFYQALVRVGLVGLVLLALGCWRLFELARNHVHPPLAWMAFCVLLTSFTVNPSLDSANFIFANALMVAWLVGPLPSRPGKGPS